MKAQIAAQLLTSAQFIGEADFQCVGLGSTFAFEVESDKFVQILHNGHNHWLTISSVGTTPGQNTSQRQYVSICWASYKTVNSMPDEGFRTKLDTNIHRSSDASRRERLWCFCAGICNMLWSLSWKNSTSISNICELI